MKRIILSLVTILAAVAMVAGATRAVFSATDSFIGNTISTATVRIDARSETGNNPARLPKPLNVAGLVPTQWTNWARGVVFNQADSTPVRLYMYLDNISGVACGKTNIQVYTGHAADGADSERGIILMNAVLGTYSGAGNRIEITGPGKIFNPTIGTNTSAVLQQRAQLDGTADNFYEGTSCTWDEVFVAETPTF